MNNPSAGQQHARPAAKCVDVNRIREWIPEPSRRSVKITTAWMIIKNHYCAAMVGRGVCPIECEVCREVIISMFGLDEATKPEALLTWRAKDRSASMIEKLIAAQKYERFEEEFPALEKTLDPFAFLYPKKHIENLFDEMLSDYD